ncbi:MAG: hypothetical protein H6626_06925 [Pseudobdellovibrionaceae bacterium]|nr:hypothetical protein [Bdellovibrionales bacterium]USN48816.1 MAG: hypothetical protein H6626_06925 [Pseudobdellovibrionaceae bacterium]
MKHYLLAILMFYSICLGHWAQGSSRDGKPKGSSPANPSVSSFAQANYLRLKAKLYSYDTIQNTTGRTSEFSVTEVLGELHPWFKTHLSLKNFDKDRPIYLVSPIPETVIQDLAHLQGRFKSGIGILNADFWKQVGQIQSTGLNVGFFVHEKGWEYGGFFSSEHNLIAFDIFANPGTPKHEWRHYYQHIYSVTPYFFELYKNGFYTKSCYEQFSSHLKELDANTHQMDSWVGSFEFTAELSQVPMNRRLYLPQLINLKGFFEYPKAATTRIPHQGCPDEVYNLVSAITNSVDAFIQPTVRLVSQLRQGLRRTQKYSQTLMTLLVC